MGVSVSHQCLALVKGKLQKSSAVVQDFHSLARQMEDKLTGKEMEVWAMVAWSIWNARNRFCFEKKRSQPCDILHSAMSPLQDYQRLTQHLAGQNHPTWWGLSGLRDVTSLYVNSGPRKCKTLWGFPCSFINEILSSVSKKKKKKNIPLIHRYILLHLNWMMNVI